MTSGPAARERLREAYARLHAFGPEYGGDEEGNHGMTNHGPMAVEVVLRRGLDVDVDRWLDRYVRRLQPQLPAADPITDDTWPTALGDQRRLPDWTAWFSDRLRARPWPEVLTTWWPRLLPGIVAGSTHGVIRVGHAVRALRAADEDRPSTPTLDELAHGLAFWAARYRPLPGASRPTGNRSVLDAYSGIPRLTDQTGLIAHRLDRLGTTAGWSDSLSALRPPVVEEVPERLAELVEVATRTYLTHGHGAPVLLVHAATAPNAVRHVLPSLPLSSWPASFAAAWAAAAAVTATYAPLHGVARDGLPPAIHADDPASEALSRAADHGDEHVLKFTDTAVDVFHRTGDPDVLTAATRAAGLIARP